MSNQKYEAFLKTAELGSFKKAAEALGYTQAGISYMLNTLENELGLTLFVRDYGGVQLTADGNQILSWVQEVCNSERRLHAKLADLKCLELGTLRVGAFTSVAIQWLPGIMQSFLKEYPNIKFELRCSDDQAEMERLVQRGDVDCGFFVLPVNPELFTIPLKRDSLLMALPQNHPLSEAPYFPIDSLSKYPYIELDEGSFSEMRDIFTFYGVKPNIAFRVENSYAAMALVSKGFGFSIFPELFLQGAFFPMVFKELEIPAHRELAISTRSQETASLATKTFLKYVEQWVHQF
ncbi:LysR family transcriptional regulator [Clostridium aminobutyricum]|uniref:LysR family transcriptional regulator n=1 Tax=Clostridium aminobutyricum TaxID=33953 RepID=A0A939D9U0_CLOAM|nr:LysR family transcriptional regulator [Clostridium aminobutyricum]MBN7773866.1 LysR family transcriptional regulator [Clostridium aminobutyricum]